MKRKTLLLTVLIVVAFILGLFLIFRPIILVQTNQIYILDHEGHGFRLGFSGKNNFRFHLPSSAGSGHPYKINTLQLLPYKGGNLFMYEFSDYSVSGGWALALHDANLKNIWFKEIPIFNPIFRLSGDYLYLADSDFLAKIDLTTGLYLWKYDDLRFLSDRADFSGMPQVRAFETPELDNGKVIFKEKAGSGFIPLITISVDDQTGEIKLLSP